MSLKRRFELPTDEELNELTELGFVADHAN